MHNKLSEHKGDRLTDEEDLVLVILRITSAQPPSSELLLHRPHHCSACGSSIYCSF